MRWTPGPPMGNFIGVTLMRMRASMFIGCAVAALGFGALPASAADLLPPEPPFYEPPPPAFEMAESSCLYVRGDGGYSFNERPSVTKNHGIAFGEDKDDSWVVDAGLRSYITP